MKPTSSEHSDFLARKPIPGIALQHNDYVRVVSGPLAPDSGSVVSIERVGADPVYVVELESGTDQSIPQNHLKFVAHD